uniref:TSC22 domain family protein 2-like n=1 Tax=Cynoglossus semilaevis TaxID=244447 RepID=A0A3P8VX15_CYNSE
MSKMPAKKKSCFQITSVTQAQAAVIGGADDTESLDDPDESRTEDVSSEIYDLSRAEYEPANDRSSSEEALNNVGEPEAVGVMASSQIPQGGQQPQGAAVTTGLSLISHPGALLQQQQQQQQQHQQHHHQSAPGASSGTSNVSVNTSQTAAVTGSVASPATSTVSCTSRFRVIKLDHGTGEPFRRGRWTCTEFYEKDSDSRTADSIRHASATLDSTADRDKGLVSVASSATHSGHGSSALAEASLSSPRMHPVEATQPQQQQQIRQQSFSSSVKPTSGQVQPTGGGLQPSAPQSGLPVGLNGLPQSAVQIQKSPIMPPSAQPAAYPPQHPLATQPQQPSQSLPVSSLSAGLQPWNQGPTSVIPSTSGGSCLPSQVGEIAGAASGSVPTGPAMVLQQQPVGVVSVGGSMLAGGSSLQLQQTLSQYAAAGQPQALHPTPSTVQSVPAVAVSSSAPTAVPVAVPSAVPSASIVAMPNVTASSLPLGQSKTPAALGPQGHAAPGFVQVEGGGVVKKPEGKEPAKPLMPESLQLTTPAVNSLFGIHIPVDGEEDRNPSKAFYQVFQSGSKLRDSKAHSDSASGSNVVAIDNKIEQAMDLVKSHLMYAVREEVEVLKEQIKELFERNSVLERENAVLKSLANTEQLSQLSSQPAPGTSAAPPQQGLSPPQQQQQQTQPQPQPQPQTQPQTQPQLQHLPKLQQQLQTQPQLDPGQQQQQQQQLQPSVTSA